MNKQRNSDINWGKMPLFLWGIVFVGMSVYLFTTFTLQSGRTLSSIIDVKVALANSSSDLDNADTNQAQNEDETEFFQDQNSDSEENVNNFAVLNEKSSDEESHIEKHDDENDSNKETEHDHEFSNNSHPTHSATGSIKVCKIILDKNGNVISGGAGSTFTVPWLNESYEGPATGEPNSAVFSTPLSLQTVFGNTKGECVTFDNLTPGRYYYGEEQISSSASWETPKYHDQVNITVSNLSQLGTFNKDLDPQYDNFDGVINISANQNRTLIVLNQQKESINNNPIATIVATKIVCSNESDLPNWGLGGPSISSTTAVTYVNGHSGCHFESGWQFEWGPSGAEDPGKSFIGPAQNLWTTFGSTDSNGVVSVNINPNSVGGKIWVREILESNYIPFTFDQLHKSNSNNVSAEMYCNTDVLNYDNYDNIVNPQANATYYCVAWNVSKTIAPPLTPSVTLSANPSTILLGATSSLAWSSSNTTACSAPWTGATTTLGTQIVSPASTTSYEITCDGPNGNATSTVTVIVTTDGGGDENNPTVNLISNPETIIEGATSTLSWISNDASSCSAPWTLETAISGAQIVNPATTTTYTIVCTHGLKSASSSATIVVLPLVPTVALSSDFGTIQIGQSATLTWLSSNTTACSAPWTGATTTLGTQIVSPASTTSYEITCDGPNGSVSANTTIIVTDEPTINPPTSGGGGGGHSGDRARSVPAVLGASTSLSCDYLKEYLHIGWDNNSFEVLKLQIFLKELAGFKDLKITGIFDQATFDAVSLFQVEYQPDVLTPWGYEQGASTGYVYILTKKKVNEIVCARAFPLNTNQQQEIIDFKSFFENLNSRGIDISGESSSGVSSASNVTRGGATIFSTKTPVSGAVKGSSTTTKKSEKIGFIAKLFEDKNMNNVAAAVFAGPQGWQESLNSLLIFFAILLAIYLFATAIVSRQNKNDTLTLESQKTRKVFLFILGLILAIVGSIALKVYAIVLPLLVLVILLSLYLLWFITSKNKILSQTEMDLS